MARFSSIRFTDTGFSGSEDINGQPTIFQTDFPLFLIKQAWDVGVNFDDLADGFGKRQGTMGDWSAVRDSTDGAIVRMFERSLNHFFDPRFCGGLAPLSGKEGR